ncbi:hypothetical protein F4803DRAFT_553682 [Xylaria telfairii]|nr:hypothetical protein F4803DRAFT_553682 [Xylaria telfairii]
MAPTTSNSNSQSSGADASCQDDINRSECALRHTSGRLPAAGTFNVSHNAQGNLRCDNATHHVHAARRQHRGSIAEIVFVAIIGMIAIVVIALVVQAAGCSYEDFQDSILILKKLLDIFYEF